MYLCEVCGEYRYYSCHKVELVQQRLCNHLKCEGIIIALGLRSSQLYIQNRMHRVLHINCYQCIIIVCLHYIQCRAQLHPILTPSVLEHLGRKPAVYSTGLHWME